MNEKITKNQQGGNRATAGGYKITSLILLILAILVLTTLFVRHFLFRETPYTRAIALIRAGKAASALPILEKLSLQHPENTNILPWLAQGYLSCERIAEGRIALDTALRMDLPASDVINTVKAYVSFYKQRGDFEEAEKLLQSASSNCPAQMLNEERAKLYADWAEADLDENNIEEAIKQLEKAHQLSSFIQEPLHSIIPRRLAEAYKRLSGVYEAAENYPEAANLLQKSLSVIDEPATRMSLAQLYVHLKKIDEAIENYQIVADADANNLEARHHLIDLLIQSGNLVRAQEALVELINKEKSIENYQQLVDVALQLNNYAGAVHALEDACDLGPKSELLEELLAVLNNWEEVLTKEHKFEEAVSVKGHAERVSEQLSEALKDEANQDENKNGSQHDQFVATKDLPVALISSHIWLSPGSLTPEGEIKIKNVTGKSVSDLTLTAVFYDHTMRRNNGTVTLPVVTPTSAAFTAGSSRTLYFSCPDTVRAEHQLAVRLFWHGYFLKEFPVAKHP